MSNISLDLSGKVDPVLVDLLLKIKEIAKEVNIDFFVIGATARDLILEKGYRISAKQATKDVDLGVMVNGWDTYRKLIEKLLSTGQFVIDKKSVHRLLYKASCRSEESKRLLTRKKNEYSELNVDLLLYLWDLKGPKALGQEILLKSFFSFRPLAE
jgi:predicted nucleotidyltransferase